VILILIPTWLSLRTFTVNHGPAKLYFSTPYTQVMPGEQFTLDLRVNTNGRAINAVQSHISIDPRLASIIGMTTDQSFCSLYTENTFSASQGTVDIACGTPHPGFEGDSLVVSLTLRANAAGSGTITVDPQTAQVLADDGKGTDILGNLPIYDLSVKQGSY